MRAAIGLGSNQGDRLANLGWALLGLRQILDGISVGPLFRTAPESDLDQPDLDQPDLDQPDYFNTAVVGACRLAPEDLLAELKLLELGSGRRRAARHSPRPLDLDLLLYGDLLLLHPELSVPHPRLEQRVFALAPLAALAPDWRVPPSGLTVATLLARRGGAAELELLAWPEGAPPSAPNREPRC